jgi:hypothetical protein
VRQDVLDLVGAHCKNEEGTTVTAAIARVMNRIAQRGYATLGNAALVPTGARGLDAEILVLYADRRYIRLVRRVLDGHTAFDALEAVVPVSRLGDILKSPILAPLLHDIHGARPGARHPR